MTGITAIADRDLPELRLEITQVCDQQHKSPNGMTRLDEEVMDSKQPIALVGEPSCNCHIAVFNTKRFLQPSIPMKHRFLVNIGVLPSRLERAIQASNLNQRSA